MKRPAHLAQTVVYRSIGGAEYAAMIVDVTDLGCALTTWLPSGASGIAVTRVPYFQHHEDAPESGPACYPPKGF